ncbi:MAG: SDR family NAD(P)-dependent oxidoreductase [Acidimicrobiales bacterium]
MGMLDGKSAIVTGGGRGIGRGEALALANEGACVVVNDLDLAAAKAVVAEIEATGGSATANSDDVASWQGATALVDQAIDEHGRLDVLVNNAGFLRDSMCFNLDEAAWDDVIRVHLKGHFAPSRAAAIHWRSRAKAGEANHARIVNTASEAGLFGNAGQANYAAAKAGIVGMTIAMARELAKYGVTVNVLAPRARTRLTEDLLGDMGVASADSFDEWHPDNVGPVVAWLASDATQDISGQVFVVFGGRVHLMDGWTVAGEIEQGERWAPEAIEAHRGELFGSRNPGVPPMGFGR